MDEFALMQHHDVMLAENSFGLCTRGGVLSRGFFGEMAEWGNLKHQVFDEVGYNQSKN